jgi:hypothetical protein
VEPSKFCENRRPQGTVVASAGIVLALREPKCRSERGLDRTLAPRLFHHGRGVAVLRTLVLLMLALFCACSRPPADDASASDRQVLPFDRQSRSTGVSPSQSLIPSTTKLPEGTVIPIRLQQALSSASSHAGDAFSAIIDEAVAINGQTLLARGTPVTGRVLEARSSGTSPETSLGSSRESSPEPGYLRIMLVSLDVGGKTVMIETSSIFAKGGAREERNMATGTGSGSGQNDKDDKDKDRDIDRDRNKDKDKNWDKDKDDIVFGTDRRLNFRLAQTLDLQ